MFINLRKALDRRCISLREYADFLGISEAAVQDKLEGGKTLSYWEFRRTCDLLHAWSIMRTSCLRRLSWKTVLPELPSVSLHMAMGRKGTS